jgi:hypothetical protein
MLLEAPLDVLLLPSTKRHILFLVYANFPYFSAQNAPVSLAARSEESFRRIGKAMRRVGRRNREKQMEYGLPQAPLPLFRPVQEIARC